MSIKQFSATASLAAMSLVIMIGCGSGYSGSKSAYKDVWSDPANYSSRANPIVRDNKDNDSMYTPQYGFCGPKDLTTFSCQ